MLVIDASRALAWVFERQQPEDAQRASRLLSSCGGEPWWVPALWHLQVANALLVAARRSVIASSGSDLFRARLRALLIETDATPPQDAEPRIFSIARTQTLSSYEATDLELAQRLDASPSASTGGSTRRHDGWMWLWRLDFIQDVSGPG